MLVSDQVPDVLIGDPWRFRQIITNLVGNSMKVSFRSLVASMFSFLASCSCVWSIPPLIYTIVLSRKCGNLTKIVML